MDRAEILKGKVYFLVTYFDEELLVPNIESVFFLGDDVVESAADGLYFQLANKFFEMGACKNGQLDEYGVIFVSNDSLDCVHDYAGLQQEIEYMRRGGARYYPDA